MEKINPLVTHISDTALWVAVYRAMETKRRNALFRDPYAEILAGERGKEIVKNLPYGKSGAWSMIVRTAVMDEFINRIVGSAGADTVVNLAAGLDTRPYRLDLPGSVHWIEVDFPDMISYKEAKLAGVKPVCSLERIKLDLNNNTARIRLFERINHDAKRVLVITEGLLVYLNHSDVASLASDLSSQSKFRWWIIDILTPFLLEWLLKRNFSRFREGSVQMRFAPEEGADFFQRFGWLESESRSVSKEARRLKREMPHAGMYRFFSLFASKKKREFFSKLDSYFILLNR